MLLVALFLQLSSPPTFFFGKPQLISKPSVAAGGWCKGLIICFSLGVQGGDREKAGPSQKTEAANRAHFCCIVPLPPTPLPFPISRPAPTMNPQAVWGCVCLVYFSFLSTAKGKRLWAASGPGARQGLDAPRGGMLIPVHKEPPGAHRNTTSHQFMAGEGRVIARIASAIARASPKTGKFSETVEVLPGG